MCIRDRCSHGNAEIPGPVFKSGNDCRERIPVKFKCGRLANLVSQSLFNTTINRRSSKDNQLVRILHVERIADRAKNSHDSRYSCSDQVV